MYCDFLVVFWLILWACVHDADHLNPIKYCINLVMNEDKIEKYFSKCSDLDKDLPRRKLTPIILTDSKARYLYQESICRLEHGIVWLYEPGLRAEDGIKWIRTQLNDLQERFGKFELFVFLGTCDLGLKNSQGLILRPRVSSVICRLIRLFREFAELARKEGYSVTILEIPAFCIQEYNRVHGHRTPAIFKDHDKGLHTAIRLVNEGIRDINKKNGKFSPRFNCALDKTRKNNTKSKPNKYRWTFGQFVDGLHPNAKLSKYWLRKIAEIIRKRCY